MVHWKHIIMYIIIFSIASIWTKAGPVGYEYSSDLFHTWNQNPYGDDRANIWFNVSSGYMQFFNGEDQAEAINRSMWLTHSFGLGYDSPTGLFNYLTKDTLNNPTIELSTDNLTYWRKYIYKCLNMSGPVNNRVFCAGWKRAQQVNDTHMKNNFYFYVNQTQGNFTLLREMYYIWSFNNISIENDNVTDYVRYCNTTYAGYENCANIYIGDIGYLRINNLTSFGIYDSGTDRGHEILFDYLDNISMIYDNGEVMLLAKIGMLVNWQGLNTIKMRWIDADSIDYRNQTISVSLSNNVTGYIDKAGLAYTVVGNTNPITLRNRNTGQLTYSYFGFNLSEIPYYADVTSVTFYHNLLTKTALSPTNWRSNLYISNRIGSLDSSDWAVGNFTQLVDWSNYCAGNYPCTTVIPISMIGIGNAVKTEIEYAIKDNKIFTIKLTDNSLYDFFSPVSWSHTSDGIPRDESQIQINYTVGCCNSDYYGMSDWEISRKLYCSNWYCTIPGTIIITQSGALYKNENVTFDHDLSHYAIIGNGVYQDATGWSA